MPRNYTSMTTLINTKLQSAGTMDYTVAEVNYQIQECLKEFATYKPHLVEIPFFIESRYGTDLTGSTSAVCDTVKSQFLTTDAANEKVVYNSTDHTWAVVKASTSVTVLNLSADIMDTNENYRIYNRRCYNERQIYVGDILPQVLDVESVEYPRGVNRNWKLLHDGIMEIDVDSVPNSNANVTNLPDTEVAVRFKRTHILSDMADLSGLVAGTSGAKAATTMNVSGVTASSTIQSGSEFYIQYHRQYYVTTADATASTGGIAAISFYPGLEAVAASASVVTFVDSTLKPMEEDVFADLCAARLAINKAPKLYSQANSCIATIALAATAISNMTAIIAAATANVTLAGSATLAGTVDMAAATVAFGKIDAQIAAGTVAASSALVLINTMPTVLGAENDWMQQASVNINLANGYMNEGLGYLREMQADFGLSESYSKLVVSGLSNAYAYVNQANTDLKQVSSMLSVSNSGRLIQSWGENKLAETLNRLRNTTKARKSVRYSVEL